MESALRSKFYDLEAEFIDAAIELTARLPTDISGSQTASDITGRAEALAQRVKELQEIASWTFDADEKASEPEEVEADRLQQEHGFTFAQITEYFAHTRRALIGRPPTKKRLTVEVYNLRLREPDTWTWRKLAERFCDCGQSRHNLKCEDRLRAEVKHLKTFLREHGITIS